MKALVLDGSFELDMEYPKPDPADGEALIKPILAGICATDLELAKGYMGFAGVLGHEFVGIVESSQNKELVGRRVAGEINCPCGTCELCRSGNGNHCPNRSVLGILNRNGAFAEYFTLPTSNLHIVPDNVPDRAAVFTEPLAAAFQILEQISISGKTRVAVLGDGKLGLLAAQAIETSACDLVLIGRHGERLDILSGRGITTMLENETADEKDMFDVVVDATGSDSGIALAVELVKPRGTIVVKSTMASRDVFDINRLVIDEITLVGSRCGPFDVALRALEKGVIDFEPLIYGVIPLENGVEAIRMAERKENIKILLSME